ncbi:GTP pyrophosphokinase [Burkholderia sp. Ac-20345]|uniref:GTP pyrophosphokinase n=1 Tax=Burkholderia sp. Ac-20345 TaxID=2703891 RepID=UPI00197BCBEE|nr:GTP pyrophosphokinase [Burkholderia sp. Ac-20345]MBN3776942.1 GTP pyrophosphokinase [Burkholderia sp. Ac-20345]
MATLERAIQIMVEVHSGQVDKGGNPYVLHPMRVMLAGDTDDERMVGALHDAIEDSRGVWTAARLRAEGFSARVVDAVVSVTRLPGESYGNFIRRAATDPIGRKVKLRDIDDNSDLSRIQNPTQRDLDRVVKYRRAITVLTAQN